MRNINRASYLHTRIPRTLRFRRAHTRSRNTLSRVCRELLGVLLLALFFVIVAVLALTSTAGIARAQQTASGNQTSSYDGKSFARAAAAASSTPDATTTIDKRANDSPEERERILLERIEQLERRLAALEVHVAASNSINDQPSSIANPTSSTLAAASTEATRDQTERETTVHATPVTTTAHASNSNISSEAKQTDAAQTGSATSTTLDAEDRSVIDFFRDTTINLTIDGYYGYNFNTPVGGINLLRAYDVKSNSFSLNQAAVIIERTPDVEAGRRYGLRLDLQYGQATETVQGSAANEPRPQAYRNIWQAYGTYVAPVGNGLTVDFGKFAGSLGYESNYTKDNFNYSRAYFFNALPFYHFGFRTTYQFNDKLTLQNWFVNGAQQSEDFNGFKSFAALVTYKPTSRVTSSFNYYNGQEGRDRNPVLNPGIPALPTQPGLSTDIIRPIPNGRFHVLDTYHTLNVTDALTFAFEADYVVGRTFRDSPPATIYGGAAYARYQFTNKFAGAARFEYLREQIAPGGGLFTGVNQALKEGTITAEYKFANGFLGRAEYRRDFSNVPFFLTEHPGFLKKEQNTATLGLVFWIGRKEGTW